MNVLSPLNVFAKGIMRDWDLLVLSPLLRFCEDKSCLPFLILPLLGVGRRLFYGKGFYCQPEGDPSSCSCIP